MDIVKEVDVRLRQEEVHADGVNDIRKCNPQTVLIDDALGVGNHGRRDDLRLEMRHCSWEVRYTSGYTRWRR